MQRKKLPDQKKQSGVFYFWFAAESSAAPAITRRIIFILFSPTNFIFAVVDGVALFSYGMNFKDKIILRLKVASVNLRLKRIVYFCNFKVAEPAYKHLVHTGGNGGYF